jgi:SWI/SNF-related matrix-associated actin-dependent regulator of chromatin subfamily A3
LKYICLQAIDRVHRIGQTRDVEVVRFVVEDTIEESIIKLQQTKDEIANRVVAPSAADIKSIFNIL